MNGIVKAIYICPVADQEMQSADTVETIAGKRLLGDRYCEGLGSFSKSKSSGGIQSFLRNLLKKVTRNRQVTFMNVEFFQGSGFEFKDSRRNIFVEGVELMWLIGREFKVGTAHFCGVKYCDPCNRPSKLSGNKRSFKEVFFDRGGLIAEVLESGLIKVGDQVIPPPKGY